jgi:hypothetical protein
VAADPAGVDSVVVVWSHARNLLREFRPQAWVVLQDLMLDAEWRDGRLVASSSARLVAEHLHIDPGTAAAGLRTLRDRGVVELTQSSGAGGRFGLAAYTLLLPPGLEVLSPRVDEPCAARPRAGLADRVEPVRQDPCVETPHAVTSSPTEATPDASPRPRRRRTATPREWSQGVLELGTGDS